MFPALRSNCLSGVAAVATRQQHPIAENERWQRRRNPESQQAETHAQPDGCLIQAQAKRPMSCIEPTSASTSTRRTSRMLLTTYGGPRRHP